MAVADGVIDAATHAAVADAVADAGRALVVFEEALAAAEVRPTDEALALLNDVSGLALAGIERAVALAADLAVQ